MANFYDVPVYKRKRFAYLLKFLFFWRQRALSLIELGSAVYKTIPIQPHYKTTKNPNSIFVFIGKVQIELHLRAY